MNLQQTLAIFIVAIFMSTGCSVYKSSGRKSFEGKSAGNTRGGVVTQNQEFENSSEADVASTCWNRPAKEALWHIDTQYSLNVSPVSDDEIQVCIQEI